MNRWHFLPEVIYRMGGFYSCLGPNYQLPEQTHFCTKDGTECGYLFQKVGRSWKKRLAVLTPEGAVILYKYYLYGISPGIPLVGRVYKVKNCKKMDVTMKGRSLLVVIVTQDDKELQLKFKGNDSMLCAEALTKRCIQREEKQTKSQISSNSTIN